MNQKQLDKTRLRTDPIYFANEALGMSLHDGQVKYLLASTLGVPELREKLEAGELLELEAQIKEKIPLLWGASIELIRRFILSCANRWGKAQWVEEPILTPTGWKRMGDVKVGDDVFSQDGSSTKVTEVFPQGVKPLYKLTFDDGSSVEVCDDHTWTIKTAKERFKPYYRNKPNINYGKWINVTTAEMRRIDLSKPRNRPVIPAVDPIRFPEVEVLIDPYTLGVLLGDGSTVSHANFTSDDPDIVSRIEKKYRVTKHKSKYAYGIYGLDQQLIKLGLMGKRAWEKSIPNQYLYNSAGVRLDVLRGLMDTDGHIDRYNKVQFYSTSQVLAEQVREIIWSLGGKATFRTKTTSYRKNGVMVNCRPCFIVTMRLKDNPFYLPRKAEKYSVIKRKYTFNRVLRSIEYTKDAEAQCITVAHPSELYVTKDYIVTHNSAIISILQLWYLFNKFGIKAKNDEDWFNIEYRTGNIAPYSSLTEPVFQAMKAILTSSYPIRGEDGVVTTNKCKIEWFFLPDKTINSPPYKLFFINNSYIEHLSLMGGKGDNLQGKPYGLITYDEAPRSDHLQMELDNSILGRLLDWTAPLHLLGTPDQDSNSLLYYHDMYKEGLVGLNNSYTQEGSIYENKFMTKEQIKDHEDMLEGNPLKDQMLHGKFIFGTQNIFPGQDILDAEDEALDDGVRYETDHKYAIGVDTAIGSDEMVYTVLDITQKPFRLVWMEAVQGNSRSPQMHLLSLCNLVDNYRKDNSVEMVVETWNGESARFYEDLPPYIKAFTHTYGAWQPSKIRTDNHNPAPNRANNVKKADILVALKKVLAAHELKIPKKNYELIKQLNIYKEEDKKLPTDRVMSLALAVWLAEDATKKNQGLQMIDL